MIQQKLQRQLTRTWTLDQTDLYFLLQLIPLKSQLRHLNLYYHLYRTRCMILARCLNRHVIKWNTYNLISTRNVTKETIIVQKMFKNWNFYYWFLEKRNTTITCLSLSRNCLYKLINSWLQLVTRRGPMMKDNLFRLPISSLSPIIKEQ